MTSASLGRKARLCAVYLWSFIGSGEGLYDTVAGSTEEGDRMAEKINSSLMVSYHRLA